MLDASRKDLIAGVAGSGTMGRGIVQVLAQAGVQVRVYDAKPGAGQSAKEAIGKSLAGLVQKGRVQQTDADSTLARIEIVDGLAAFAPCHLVVEAVLEQLEIKRELWQAVEKVVSETCILASNTSSLSVTAMAAGCVRPGRVVGYHFFNPVPVMKVVEVVDGVLTEPWVGDALMQLAKRFGHTPVRCNDTPGFIVNHAGRGFVPESLRVLSEGVADFAAIDRILVDAAGFRLGPFGLMDLVGLDVGHAVMKSMYEQYFDEPKYKPFQVAETRVAAGLLGRKTGRGWYAYKDGTIQVPPEPPAPAARPESVWVAQDSSTLGTSALNELVSKLGARLDGAKTPAPGSLCLVAPLGHDATTTALALGIDPARTVAVDPMFGFSKRRTLMSNPLTSAAMLDAAHGLLASDGVPVSVIKDSPGFVAQRVVAHIVNVGCDIVQQRVASPEDLDRAVMLGLGYPKGPLGMGDAIGAARVLTVLEAMHAFYQEPRYRPSPWLKRRAKLGISLLTPE